MIEGLAALLQFFKVSPNVITGDNSKPSPDKMGLFFPLTLRLGRRLLIHKQWGGGKSSKGQAKHRGWPSKISKWSIIYLNLRNITVRKRNVNSYIKSDWFRPMVTNLRAMCCPGRFPAKLMDKEIQIYNVSNQRGRSDAAHCALCALFTWQRRLGNHHQVPALPPLSRDLLFQPHLTNDTFLLTSLFLFRRAFKALKCPQLSHCSLNDPWSVYLRDVISTYCFLSCLLLQTAHLTLFHMARTHLADLSRVAQHLSWIHKLMQSSHIFHTRATNASFIK